MSKPILPIVVLCLAVLTGLGLWLTLPDGPPGVAGQSGGSPAGDVPVVSTRGHVVDGALVAPHSAYDYDLPAPLPGYSDTGGDPFDVLIVVHGSDLPADKAQAIFATARESLNSHGFTGVLVGFSWNADAPVPETTGDPAGLPARLNGPKLARLLLDYRAKCPVTRLHVIGCEAGADIILEALLALETDRGLKAGRFRMNSVHLISTTVPLSELSDTGRYGRAIEMRTRSLVNYCATAPDADPDAQSGTPAMPPPAVSGDAGTENRPQNIENRVVPGIPVAGSDEAATPPALHAACFGYRDDTGRLVGRGLMNLVADHIRGRTDEPGQVP